jgi:hypothetical protein
MFRNWLNEVQKAPEEEIWKFIYALMSAIRCCRNGLFLTRVRMLVFYTIRLASGLIFLPEAQHAHIDTGCSSAKKKRYWMQANVARTLYNQGSWSTEYNILRRFIFYFFALVDIFAHPMRSIRCTPYLYPFSQGWYTPSVSWWEQCC